MPRRSRIEYEGACYHVINRGNYREWVFGEDGAREAFEQCLGEAAERSEWKVHGWVVMGNHFHLAVETPRGNLGAGMQWLQTTYAARFNRYRKENGHLFQGRYKAIVLEKKGALGRVCHYVDLNPVRAGVVDLDSLETYRQGSFRRLQRPKERPAWQEVNAALAAAGGLADTGNGRTAYRRYLGWVLGEMKAGRAEDYAQLSKGWAIGSDEFKEELQQRFGPEMTSERALAPEARKAWREGQWKKRLKEMVAQLPAADKTDRRASAPWKAVVAWKMKSQTEATNSWLAEALELSSPTYVSKQAGLARDGKLGSRAGKLIKRLKSKDCPLFMLSMEFLSELGSSNGSGTVPTSVSGLLGSGVQTLLTGGVDPPVIIHEPDPEPAGQHP